MISDGGVIKRVGVDSLRDHYFGVVSGDATIADGGALTIAAGAVENAMLAGSIANAKLANSTISGKALGTNLDNLSVGGTSGLAMSAYNGSAAVSDLAVVLKANSGLAKDANGVAVVLDSAGGLEFNGSDGIRLEAAVAGSGLSHNAGVLAVQVSGAVKLASDKVGLTGSIAGNGLAFAGGADSISSLTIDANPDSFVVDGLGLQLAANVAGNGLALNTGVLSVGVDGSSIELNSDALRVKALGITNAMLAGSIANAKLANSTISGKALGANLDALAVDDSSIEYSAGSAFNGSAASTIRVKASGITNAMLGGSIANAKLSNSAVTLTQGAGMAAMGSVSLGGSVTVAVDGVLEDLDTLGPAGSDGQFIVATGAGAFAYESGNTARTSLGLGTGNDVTFTDLTLTGDLTVAGALTYVNTTNLAIKDALITIGSGSAAFAADHGMEFGAMNGGWASLKTHGDLDGSGVDGFLFSHPIKASKFYGDVEGASIETVQTLTNAGTIDTANGTQILLNNSSAAAFTLPAASAVGGLVIKIKRIHASGVPTIQRDGSDTIDGETSVILDSEFAAISLISNGSDKYFII